MDHASPLKARDQYIEVEIHAVETGRVFYEAREYLSDSGGGITKKSDPRTPPHARESLQAHTHLPCGVLKLRTSMGVWILDALPLYFLAADQETDTNTARSTKHRHRQRQTTLHFSAPTNFTPLHHCHCPVFIFTTRHNTTQHNTVLRTRYRNPRHAFAGRPRPEASRTYHSQTTSIPNFNPQSDSCREPQALISITIFRKNARAFFLRTSFAIKTSCITNRTPALSAQQYQAAIFCYRRPILSRCT